MANLVNLSIDGYDLTDFIRLTGSGEGTSSLTGGTVKYTFRQWKSGIVDLWVNETIGTLPVTTGGTGGHYSAECDITIPCPSNITDIVCVSGNHNANGKAGNETFVDLLIKDVKHSGNDITITYELFCNSALSTDATGQVNYYHLQYCV